jgi:predicted aldo/keto reductase-like oxidoreductase
MNQTMQYRKLGRTGVDVSAISLGTEYLINLPRDHVVSVIHSALDHGINYFDLFFAQPEFRDNMGFAFKGHRDKAMFAAHLGSTDQNGQYERTRDLKLSMELIDDFLRRYNTDYVDVIYLHNSDGQEDYDLIMNNGFLGTAQKYVKEGKARFIAFSGHTVSTAKQAVESGDIDILMFPINLANNVVEGRKELLNACVKHNVGLVAMKPYAGGKLLQKDQLMSLEHYQLGADKANMEKPSDITAIQCLSYALTQVGVSNIVPGCKTVEHLDEALSYFNATDEEKDFSNVIEYFQQFVEGDCVYCNHCLPCPSEIDIGQTIRLFEMAQNGITSEIRSAYDAMKANASDCVQCGSCEERCPFGVEVISKMEQADKLF